MVHRGGVPVTGCFPFFVYKSLEVQQCPNILITPIAGEILPALLIKRWARWSPERRRPARKARPRSSPARFSPMMSPALKAIFLRTSSSPALRIADVVSIMLFGEGGRIGGRKGSGSKVSYNRYYDDRRDDRREYGRPRSAGGIDYDDIIFETRADAELVLDQLEAVINQYQVASVADLYDRAGITPPRGYTTNKYGWTDIRTAKVARIRDGYILQLPRTVQID